MVTQAFSRPTFGTLEDGLDYVIKRDTQAWPGMAAELVCCHLAKMLGLPVPPFCVARDMAGKLVFASQIFGSPTQTAADAAAALRFLTGAVPTASMIDQLSKLYAFDLFTSNDDRHINNILFREQNKAQRVMIIDFDRSIFYSWPMPNLPMSDRCNTVQTARCIRQYWGFGGPAALDLVMGLARLPKSSFDFALGAVPDAWLSRSLREELRTWWSDGRRLRRLRLIWRGLKDGTLF